MVDINWVLEKYYTFNPISATMHGIKGYDDKMPDISSRGMAKFERFLESLIFANQTSSLDEKILHLWAKEQKFSLHVFARHKQDPNYVSLILSGVYSLLVKRGLGKEKRKKSISKRLSYVPSILSAAKENVTQPVRSFCESTLETIKTATIVLQTVGKILEEPKIYEDSKKYLMDYKKYVKHLRKKAGPDPIVSMEEYQEYLSYLGINIPIDTIIESAEKEIETLMPKMNKTIESIAGRNDIKAAYRKIYLQIPEEITLKWYTSLYKDLYSMAREKGLPLAPRDSVVFVKTPEWLVSFHPVFEYVPPTITSNQGILYLTIPPVERYLVHHSRSAAIYMIVRKLLGQHAIEYFSVREGKIRGVFASKATMDGWVSIVLRKLLIENEIDKGAQLIAIRDSIESAALAIADISINTGKMKPKDCVKYLESVGLLSREEALKAIFVLLRNPAYYSSAYSARLILEAHPHDVIRKGAIPPSLLVGEK